MQSRQLYQEVILDHNRKPRNYGALPAATHSSEGLNPLCGDHIRLQVHVTDGAIDAIAFEGQSCAICKASASMMTTAVKGRPVAEAQALAEEFRLMATGQLDPAAQPGHLGRLSVFQGVRDLPSRVKCAILPWHTLRAAFGEGGTASTEGEHDPLGTGTAS